MLFLRKFKCLLSHHFLQITRFAAQILYLISGRCTRSIASEPSFTCFHELLGPGVVQALRNPFLATQLGNAVITAQTL